MIYNNGLPRPTGATDFMDSAHAAGMCTVFGVPSFNSNCLTSYILPNGMAVRNPDEYPSNNPLNFTRDQMVPLVAGLRLINRQDLVKTLYDAAVARGYRAQNSEADVPGSTKKFPNGADLLTPSVMNHLRICSGQKPTLLGKLWLMADIVFYGLFTPMAEPNNIIVMSLTAGPFYTKLLNKTSPKLNLAVIDYWSGWRGEPELAALILSKLA